MSSGRTTRHHQSPSTPIQIPLHHQELRTRRSASWRHPETYQHRPAGHRNAAADATSRYLSKNAGFARLHDAGLTWVGSLAAIRHSRRCRPATSRSVVPAGAWHRRSGGRCGRGTARRRLRLPIDQGCSRWRTRLKVARQRDESVRCSESATREAVTAFGRSASSSAISIVRARETQCLPPVRPGMV